MSMNIDELFKYESKLHRKVTFTFKRWIWEYKTEVCYLNPSSSEETGRWADAMSGNKEGRFASVIIVLTFIVILSPCEEKLASAQNK